MMMSSAISCKRCKSKKIRCNRATPQCDKCIALNAECIYLPRKRRTKKPSAPADKNILSQILRRLERLEDYCGLNKTDVDQDASSPRSVSTYDWEQESRPSDTQTPIKEDGIRSLQSLRSTNLFHQLQYVGPLFFENASCVGAVEAALSEIDKIRCQGVAEPSAQISKDMAKRWIDSYFDVYQFEGFRQPLEENFLKSIPDLLEIPHVSISAAAQIIYYSVIMNGVMLDAKYPADKAPLVQCLYRKSIALSEIWLGQVQNTPTDLYAAFFMISTALEGCDSELAWRTFQQGCIIARALGFFSVDKGGPEDRHEGSLPEHCMENETEVEKNRKRFEFWHLLRMDCLFRLHFGKPAVIIQGSWAVDFPDPTINGVDDASTRFVQIHFLALMRLTLIMLKFLKWKDEVVDQSPSLAYDQTIDGYIGEVQEIMSSWNPEELLASTTNHVDMWFCVDIIFSSYQMLIIFYQSKRSNQDSHATILRSSVEIARRSVRLFQTRMGSAFFVYWGISLVLLHQFIPFLILSTHILAGNSQDDDIQENFTLVMWLNDFVQKAAAERPEARSISTMLQALTAACYERLKNNSQVLLSEPVERTL